MEKQLSILWGTSRNLVTSNSSIVATPTSLDFGISNSLITIQLLLNPAVNGFFCRLSNHLGIKLQTQVALSTTDAEYIAMSQSLCDVLPNMFLI